MGAVRVYIWGRAVHLETEEERRLARSSVKSWGELRLSRDLEESQESGLGSQDCRAMVT